MGKFNGTLLVSDLDGTFFGRGTSIPQRNVDAVRYFMENGGLFTICTGRSVSAAKRIAADIPKNAPGILFNGAMIYDFDTDRVLYNDGIRVPQAVELVKSANARFPDTQSVIFQADKLFSTTHEQQTAVADALCMKSIYEPHAEHIPFPWYKILFGGTPEELAQISAFLKEKTYPQLTIVNSSPVLLEVLACSLNKGTGLKRLAQMLDISPDKVFAVGDYYNDEQMLKTAGTAFLPENAPAELKKLGTVVCSHLDGAVADVIAALDTQF